MSWILAILGAVLGLAFGAADETVLGLFAGATIGALLGQVARLRGRLADMDQRLARIEDAIRRRAVARADETGPAAPVAEPAHPVAPAAATDAPPGAPASRAMDIPPLPAAPGTVSTPASVPLAAATASVSAPSTPDAAEAGGTPAPPAAPRVAFETADDTPRGPDVLERAVGIVRGWLFEGNVPVKLGLLVLMFGVAGALKYAADAGWLRLPIEFRLAGIAAGAIAGLVWGLRTARERPAFGLSLQGGAIGILLLTVFAAFRRYELLAATPAFVMVVILVAGASVLAVRQNAPALAVLGFIGGYLAPVLISTGSGNHVALFSYFAVLNAAVFAIAWKKPWRALNLVGFLFTFVIGGLWGGKYYRPELFATVEPFLVLFFLFYVSIPVLYALAGRERNGKVDGTLLFGTPLLAFPMQVGLLEGDRMALAASAVAVAAIYAGLALWSLRNARLRTLAQSAAAMGVVFATLAIPLALSARWTSAAWALQGAGMVWLGLRQDRRLTRWSGLALLFLAGCAWIWSLLDGNRIDIADRFLINGHLLNLLLLSFSHLAAAWLYERHRGARVVPAILFVIGLGWWFTLGAREIEVNLEPVSSETAYGWFAAITAALAALMRGRMAWSKLAWPVALSVLAALALSAGALDTYRSSWFDTNLMGWWGITAVLLAALAGLREPRTAALPIAHISVLALAAFGIGSSLWVEFEHRFGMGGGWLLPAGLAPLAVLALAAWRWPRSAGWPAGERFGEYRTAWLAIAGTGLGLGWLIGQFNAGDSQPLPWLPLLNPLELALLLALVGGAAALRRQGPAANGWSAWAAAALLTLTMAVLRACHQLAGLPWSEAILSERLAQTSLTVAWCIAGVVAWILGSRRRNRSLWWFGAGLLGVVLLKLLFVDRQYIGNLTGIVSFVAVGLLLIIVGRIAPTPPRPE